jgi:hypothetical protein
MAPVTDKVEVLADYMKVAEAVKRMRDVGKALSASGLSQRAVTVLLQDATGLTKKDILAVLNAIDNIPKFYLAPTK